MIEVICDDSNVLLVINQAMVLHNPVVMKDYKDLMCDRASVKMTADEAEALANGLLLAVKEVRKQ